MNNINNIVHTFTTKTGKTVSFRYPTIEDSQILMDYINKISLERTFILMQGEQKTLDEEVKWLNLFLENKNRIVIILAFCDNNLVGVSDISLKTGVKNHTGSFGISIAKDFRGEGIGKELMNLVISESVKNIKDLKIIELEVFGDNPIAKDLYEKMGFVEFGRLPEGIKHQDQFVDAILMYKKIK